MGDLSREEQINRELNDVLTGLLLEVFSGITKKEDALEILSEMRAKIEPAIKAIDETINKIKQERQRYGIIGKIQE